MTLRCFQGILQSLDEGRSKLSAVLDLSKTVCRNTTEDGCHIIGAELKQLDSDYNDLRLSIQVSKEQVEKNLQDWLDWWKKAEGLSTWVRDTELKLGSDQEYGGDLTEKELLLEQIKVL